MFQYFWTVVWEYIYANFSGIGEVHSNVLNADFFVYVIC
jgi:hypothetical protein